MHRNYLWRNEWRSWAVGLTHRSTSVFARQKSHHTASTRVICSLFCRVRRDAVCHEASVDFEESPSRHPGDPAWTTTWTGNRNSSRRRAQTPLGCSVKPQLSCPRALLSTVRRLSHICRARKIPRGPPAAQNDCWPPAVTVRPPTHEPREGCRVEGRQRRLFHNRHPAPIPSAWILLS